MAEDGRGGKKGKGEKGERALTLYSCGSPTLQVARRTATRREEKRKKKKKKKERRLRGSAEHVRAARLFHNQ